MPKPRVTEMPKKLSPRVANPLRTSSSDSAPINHRPLTEWSTKLGDRRSPTQNGSVSQKKLGTRIADLESQLGQAQEELKKLKYQLSSAESAKKGSSEKKAKKPVDSSESKKIETPSETEQSIDTDVFEVPVENKTIDPEVESAHLTEKEMEKFEAFRGENESLKSQLAEVTEKLVSAQDEKEKELEVLRLENETLRTQLSSTKVNEEETNLKMKEIAKEIELSRTNATNLKDNLEEMEGAKEKLEAEMKKLRIQTEQWKKAADEAATVLAEGVETSGRIPVRCGSMDNKLFGGIFETPAGGYKTSFGSPDFDDSLVNGKRRSSGIKIIGDLWKKKSQK